MEASPDSGIKQHPQYDASSSSSSSSSSSEEETKPKAAAQVPSSHTMDAGTPQSGQGRGGNMIEKEEDFRLTFVMPEYLRVAMMTAVESNHLDPPAANVPLAHAPPPAPRCPLIVLINSKSGGRQGPVLRTMLNSLLTKEQVFDLAVTRPKDIIQFGLGCLEKLGERGDQCAKDTRKQLRVIVAGGDGTVGWVLGSMRELLTKPHTPIPPVGIIPLGTGNDLSRSFGWGGSFFCAWRPLVRRYLFKADGSEICKLDSWQVTVRTSSKEKVEPPPALHPQQQGDTNGGSSDVNAASFEGVYYNYFSIGMDAQVAYGFHHLRERKPHVAQGPISNKLVYSSCGCVQGWFCVPCSANPRTRGLYQIMRLSVKKRTDDDWTLVELPHNVRAVIMLNLQSYASGRNPWGHPTDEYNQKKGFVQPCFNDGLLEIFGLFDGWHTSLVMLSMRSAKRLAQACAVRMELVAAGQRQRVYMQMDGEPWRQPLSKNEHSTVIEITHVPTHSLILRAT